MIIIISGSKVVDIKEEEIVHCMGEKKRVFLFGTPFFRTQLL